MRQDELSRARAIERCRDLLELIRQLGLEPPLDMGAEESCQERAGGGQGEHDPDDRAGEQPEAQGIDGNHDGSSSR